MDIRCDIQSGIARITLNRPDKRNAISQSLVREFQAALDRVLAEQSVRLLILAAEGPVFCAGMDLGEMQSRAGKPEAEVLWQEDTQTYHDLLWKLLTLPCPTLAEVQGPALAGGMGLLLACDLMLASESAWFSLPEPQRGITAAIVTPLLIYRVGVAAAMPMLLANRRIPAAEAHRQGWCHEVISGTDFTAAEEQWRSSIFSGSPDALARTKRLLLQTVGQSLAADLQAGLQESAAARATPDAREGLAAFLEKRPPKWQG